MLQARSVTAVTQSCTDAAELHRISALARVDRSLRSSACDIDKARLPLDNRRFSSIRGRPFRDRSPHDQSGCDPSVGRGKVRDLYAVDDALLLVATDRISAFDHVLGTGIPGKGKILTQISLFWFDLLQGSCSQPSDHRRCGRVPCFACSPMRTSWKAARCW